MADPKIELVAAAADTGGGTQAWTNTNLSDTPNAVALVGSRQTTSLNSTSSELITSTGLAIGTGSRGTIGQTRDHGNASTNTGRRSNTAACLNWTNTSASADRGTLDFSSFGSNTFTGTWDTTPTSAGHVVAMLMKMDNVDVSTIVPTSGGVSISPGFDIDVAIVLSANGADSSSNANGSWGFVTNTDSLRQCMYCNNSGSGAAAGKPNAYVSNSRCGGQTAEGSGLVYHVTASFPASNQITLTSSTAAPGDDFMVLCLNIGTGQAHCGVADTPTSTGSHTFSDANFTPTFGWLMATGMTAVDTERNDSAEAGSWAHCMMTANDQYCASSADEQGSGTTDTQTLITDTAINKPDDAGSTDLIASYTSMAATGVQVNFASVNASALKCPMLTIGGAAAAGGAFTPYYYTNLLASG